MDRELLIKANDVYNRLDNIRSRLDDIKELLEATTAYFQVNKVWVRAETIRPALRKERNWCEKELIDLTDKFKEL